jgi:hypothetical protein
VRSRVAYNEKDIFFMVESSEALTARDGEQWMRLYIDVDRDAATGWNGYDLLVNRVSLGDGRVSVEAWGEAKWQSVAEGRAAVSREFIELAIPRRAVKAEAEVPAFDFKWTDGMPDSDDVLDWIDHGDAAPPGRFNYRFRAARP